MSKKFEALERFNNSIVSKELEALQRLYEDAVVYGKYLYESGLLSDNDKSYLERIDKDYELLKQALRRNEPMKLKTKRVKVSIDDYRIDDCCPTCDEELYTTSNYRPNCEQKLD